MKKELKIRFLEKECWKCGYNYNIYYAIWKWDILEDSKNIFNKNIISKVIEWNKSNNILDFGEIKQRYSKTKDEKYMSFGFPKCDAICGDWYLDEAIIDTIYDDKGCIDDIKIEIDL